MTNHNMLFRKGTRLHGCFVGTDNGWRYEESYPSLRGNRWVACLGIARGEMSVEGATEYDPSFRGDLQEMSDSYPELLELKVRFDGAPMSIRELVSHSVTPISSVIWLHGTSDSLLSSIERDGLRPRSTTGVRPSFVGGAKPSLSSHVYLTTQENMARMAARSAAKVHGGKPVVLRIDVPQKTSLFRPDEDSGRLTAQESLSRIGSVAYDGAISPSRIVVHERLCDGGWVKEQQAKPNGLQQKLNASEAFKRWFAGSKVVDEDGEPLVVYHGTAADFSSFDVSRIGESTDAGTLGAGFYFTTSYEAAQSYANADAERTGGTPNVIQAYLRIKNPYFAPRRIWQLSSMPKEAKKHSSSLKKQGYDGVSFFVDLSAIGDDCFTEYVVFDPRQIKSATMNRGTFDPFDSDMRKNPGSPITGFDLFDVPERSLEKEIEERSDQFLLSGRGAFFGASRGDIFRAGKHKYQVYRTEGPYAVGAYRVGTKGTIPYYFRHGGVSTNTVDMREEAGSMDSTLASPVVDSFEWFPIAKQLREKYCTEEEKAMVNLLEKEGHFELALKIRSAIWAERAKW